MQEQPDRRWSDMEEGEEIEHCMPFRASTPPLTHPEPQPDPMETFAAASASTRTEHRDYDDAYRPGAYKDLYATRDDVRRRASHESRDRDRLTYGNQYNLHQPHGQNHGSRRHHYDGGGFRGRDAREPRSVNYFPRSSGGTDRTRPSTSLPAHEMQAFVFMRQRTHNGRSWFEFLLEFRNDQYGFMELPLGKTVATAAEIAAKRGLLFLPKDARDLERCCQIVVDPKAAPRIDMPHAVYFLPLEATQRERTSRTLPSNVQFIWACESELATHTQMGAPACLGHPVSARAVAAMAAMPLKLRFASMKPPLVVYHGTSVDAGNYIATAGFQSGPRSMLGPGVYFGKFDKALDFAFHDAANAPRALPGIVVRTYVFVDTCLTMTRETVCTCGCEKPFVDHDAKHGQDFDATFVPDNSLPATRRAEWCVRDPRKCFVDCLISPPTRRFNQEEHGPHSLPPQFL